MQPEEKKLRMDAQVLHSLPYKDVMDTVEPALPEVSQVFHKTVNDSLQVTSIW